MTDVIEEAKKKAKIYIDQNIHDGDDRSGCKDDWSKFNPDELQELVDDVVEYSCATLLSKLSVMEDICELTEIYLDTNWMATEYPVRNEEAALTKLYKALQANKELQDE